MAKLSAHGVEIGRIEKTSYTVAYFHDRAILANQGFGWKLKSKVKPDIDPVEAFNREQERYNKKLVENPAFKHWRDLIIKEPLYPHRLRLMTALDTFPADELDGLYIELDDCPDTRGRWSVDDLKEISFAFHSAKEEAREKHKAKPAGKVKADGTGIPS